MAVIAILFIPTLLTSIVDLLRIPGGTRIKTHVAASLHSSAVRFQQAAFLLACLPHEAMYSLDAIVRTIVRLTVSRRRLLEWNASDSADRISKAGLPQMLRSMWIGPAIAVVAAVGSMVQVYRIGESGAKAVWQEQS